MNVQPANIDTGLVRRTAYPQGKFVRGLNKKFIRRRSISHPCKGVE